MGVFDSVYFKCLDCGEEIEEQSKAGDCLCINYESEEVPYDIANDINETIIKCYECGSSFIIKSDGDFTPPPVVRMRLEKLE